MSFHKSTAGQSHALSRPLLRSRIQRGYDLKLASLLFPVFVKHRKLQASDDPQVRVWFSTLPRSLFTLFVVLTLDEWPTLALDTMSVSNCSL